MKRSAINSLIREAESFFAEHSFFLPTWCFWDLPTWIANKSRCSSLFSCNLGWDLTDFGGDNFTVRGLLLITLRNGTIDGKEKPYAEKIMIVKENQETPFHFHWNKQEDIINRGGGILVFELYRATTNETLSKEPFIIIKDGIKIEVVPGSPLYLNPGESLTLDQRVYHRFYALEGHGSVLCGEVSAVNDDTKDNRFLEQVGRFPEIEEDEEPYRLLVTDYQKFLSI